MAISTPSQEPALLQKVHSPHEVNQGSAYTLAEGVAMCERVGHSASLDNSNESSSVEKHTWPRGWRPNLCLIGCFFLMFNSWGLSNSYGSFASYYKDHLLAGKDLLLVNLIGSAQICFVLFLSTAVGRVLDAGHVKILTGTGTILISIGLFLLSVVNGKAAENTADPGHGNYGLIWLTQGLLTGLGMACFYVTSSQVVATWFFRRKSFAIGIVASGASIGGLIYPIMLKYLIGLLGFNAGVRLTATVAALTSIFASFVALPNPSHIFRKPTQGWMKLSVWIDINALRNAAFVWYVASVCFIFFGFHTIFFSLEEWAGAEGFGLKRSPTLPDLPNETRKDAIRTFWLLSIMNALSTLGRIASAYLADHYGALAIHAIFTVIGALLVLILWALTHTLSSAIAFVVLFGVASGAIIALPPAAIAHILGPDPHAQAKLGQWTGMTYSASAIFALTGPMVTGHLVSTYRSYLTVQMWAGTCFVAAAACMVVSRMYLRRQRASRRGDQELSRDRTEKETREDSVVMTSADATKDSKLQRRKDVTV